MQQSLDFQFRDIGLILRSLALPMNPYDGTLSKPLSSKSKKIFEKLQENFIIDNGRNGQKEYGITRLLTSSVPLKTDTQDDQRRQKTIT